MSAGIVEGSQLPGMAMSTLSDRQRPVRCLWLVVMVCGAGGAVVAVASCMPSTVFFDVNETLSDLSPLGEVFQRIGAPGELVSTWYASTLRDGFALNLTTGSAPYAVVAEAVLHGLLASAPTLSVSVADGMDAVMNVFQKLPVHPDVTEGVATLARAGHRLVALSNGSVDYTRDLLHRAGIEDAFDMLLSVDAAGAWKPDRRSYDYALRAAGESAEQAVLVAVHPWDLHGAKAAGFTTVFLDRTGTPWPRVFDRPDMHVGALTEVTLP